MKLKRNNYINKGTVEKKGKQQVQMDSIRNYRGIKPSPKHPEIPVPKGSSGSSSQDQEMNSMIKKYQEYECCLKIKQGEVIGKGSSGIVYKGFD